MWQWLTDHARALRAMVALCAAVTLAVMLFKVEQPFDRGRAAAAGRVTSVLWAMGELHYESQRMIAAAQGYTDGRVTLEDLRLRAESLRTRIDAASKEVPLPNPRFGPILQGYSDLLRRYDPVLFGRAPPEPRRLLVYAHELAETVAESRGAWSHAVGSASAVKSFLTATERTSRQAGAEMTAFGFIGLLLAYVLAEVYFANRAQRREAALRRAAAAANEAKSRFLAHVSHEIRTPLNGILGMASELSETRLTQDQALCLRVIEDSGAVLLGTINDVLDLSRIEAGQLHVEERPFLLRPLVEAACALYSARARQKSLNLTLQVQENLPEVLMGDDVRIRQILHNLISNALKFTDSGGVAVRVRPDLGGRRLVIAVQDSGPGIERAAQQRIFEPFLQADASVTRHHGGSGLGLSISRQLCQAMGGELSVVSRPGCGATFFCDLPLRAANDDQIHEIAQKAPPAPALDGLRVLIADDNAANRLILKRFLAGTGARLSEAETGRDALAVFRDTPCDVVLMDVQMPVMDGMAAACEIRALERRTGRPASFIVAVTANVLSHQVDGYREAGMDQILGKPVSKRDLLAVLGRRFPGGAQAGAQDPKVAAQRRPSS